MVSGAQLDERAWAYDDSGLIVPCRVLNVYDSAIRDDGYGMNCASWWRAEDGLWESLCSPRI